jgi:hypothetical protein
LQYRKFFEVNINRLVGNNKWYLESMFNYSEFTLKNKSSLTYCEIW